MLPPGWEGPDGEAGRPQNVETAIEKLASSTVGSCAVPEVTRRVRIQRSRLGCIARPAQPVGQCGRVDGVWVGPGGGVVEDQPGRVKEAWRDVPLWITVGSKAECRERPLLLVSAGYSHAAGRRVVLRVPRRS